MTDTRSDIVSVVERTRLVACAEGAIHDGAILVTAADGERIVSGGDDGKAVTTDAGSSRLLATDPKHRWIDHIAAGYGNGLILLTRIDDSAEILAKKPGDAPVTALAWSADGLLLAWGTEGGEAGVIDLA
jgi:hypothetical protein